MDTHWQLVAYVFVSIVLRIVAGQLTRRRAADVAWVRFLSEGWPASIARFVYYIGLPYVTVILGVVPGRYLGLVGSDKIQTGVPLAASQAGLLVHLRDYLSLLVLGWLSGVGVLLGLAVIALFFLGVAWAAYGYFKASLVSGDRITPAFLPLESVSLTQTLYQAVHWSFYRGAVWLLADDLYLGVVGGIILVGGEWVLDTGWMKRIGHSPWREVLLIDASVLIASAVIFFFVPNLWLVLPVQWLLEVTCHRMVKVGYEQASASCSRYVLRQTGQRAP
ncbi:MAG: hypothetical protein Kow0063_12690 [Anaerolineae bacterium]